MWKSQSAELRPRSRLLRCNPEDDLAFSYDSMDLNKCVVHEALQNYVEVAMSNREDDTATLLLVVLYHIHTHVHETMDAVSVKLFIGFWCS
jgi:hypothetical protein